MKKLLKRIIPAAVSTVMMFSTAMSAAAEKITVDPDYPIHGNKCGEFIINPKIERDVYVKLTQNSPDGDYVYYNAVIPASGASKGTNNYSFILEGKDDVSYNISIGVPKYKGSDNVLTYSYNFSVPDTDNIVKEKVNGYLFTFDITGDETFDEPKITSVIPVKKNEQNIYDESRTITFPISDLLPGDVNFNGVVDLLDAIEIAKYMINSSRFSQDQVKAGDYNGDGKTDVLDVIGIAKLMLKK